MAGAAAMHRKSGKIEAGQTLRPERFLHTVGNGSAVPIRPAAEGDHTRFHSLTLAFAQNSPAAYISADRAHSGAVSQRRMRLPSVQICRPALCACSTSLRSRPPSGPVSRAAVRNGADSMAARNVRCSSFS